MARRSGRAGRAHRRAADPQQLPAGEETQEFSYDFFATARDGETPPPARWNSGQSLDGKGEYKVRQAEPMGQEPVLGPARPDSGAQAEQIGSALKA